MAAELPPGQDRAGQWHGVSPEYLSERYDVADDPRDVARLKRELIRRHARSGDSACDVGCANGAWLGFVAPLVARAVGVDRSREMLRLAAVRARRGNVMLVEADGRSLCFADGCFELVTCFSTLSLVSEWEALLRDMCRVLRPGGRLLIDVQGRRNLGYWHWQRWHRRQGRFGTTALTRGELAAAFERMGMSVLEWRGLGALNQAQFLPVLRYFLILRRWLPARLRRGLRIDERLSTLPWLLPFAGRWLVAAARPGPR